MFKEIESESVLDAKDCLSEHEQHVVIFDSNASMKAESFRES